MHTALHTTDQLAVANAEGTARRQHAVEARAARQLAPRSGSTGRVVATLLALVVAVGLVPGPSTAAAASTSGDTYTGGGKQIQGLADGWFDPSDQAIEFADTRDRR